MRLAFLACVVSGLMALPSAEAHFKGYFDIRHLKMRELPASDWGRREEVDRLLYVCSNEKKCPGPTGIEIKGVLRSEELPAAFEGYGALSPSTLMTQGLATAKRTGSRFLTAEHVTVGGIRGVHMEASGVPGQGVYFVTRWLGEGDRLLDVKVTAADLEQARRLIDIATRELVPQVFSREIKL